MRRESPALNPNCNHDDDDDDADDDDDDDDDDGRDDDDPNLRQGLAASPAHDGVRGIAFTSGGFRLSSLGLV